MILPLPDLLALTAEPLRLGCVHLRWREDTRAASATSDQDLTADQPRLRVVTASNVHTTGETPCSRGRIVDFRWHEATSSNQNLAGQPRPSVVSARHMQTAGEVPLSRCHIVDLGWGKGLAIINEDVSTFETTSRQNLVVGQRCRRVENTRSVHVPGETPRPRGWVVQFRWF